MSCEKRITAVCEEERKAATATGESQIFEVCLPFGGKIYSQGGYVNYEEGTPPPDGVYGKVIIANGCIVGLEKDDIPLYTSSPCAPVPVPCDCDGGGSGSMPEPSILTGNLFRYDAAGRPLVRLMVSAGDNISITGTGTQDDPLVIGCTVEGAGTIVLKSGNDAISILGDGTVDDPMLVTHKTNTLGTQSIGGMAFDEYGHLIDYTKPSEAKSINGIIPGSGIAVDTDVSSGIATVSLATPLHLSEGEYQFGGYIVEVDRNNILYRIQRDITFTAGVYRAGLVDVTVNEYGSITAITPLPPLTVSSNATKKFAAGSTISMTFTTDKVSSFHITYTGTGLPTSGAVCLVDGVSVSGGIMSNTRHEWLADSLYAAGQHTVAITGVTVAGFLNVSLTAAV